MIFLVVILVVVVMNVASVRQTEKQEVSSYENREKD